MNTNAYPNTKLISIIIPLYNVEKYISQCLESIYTQDISEDLYEVICVNDASPDNSRDIVIKYQTKHKNLVLVEHDSNKKLGVARNTGRSVAKGKYIWNIDSDDFIQPNSLLHIIENCEKGDLDVLIFNFDHLRSNIQKTNEAYPFVDSDVFSGIDFINKYCLGKFAEISPVWTQVYRKEYLDNNKIYSPPINMGEDVPFTFKSLLLANRIKSITNSCYVYRLNEKSLGGVIEVIPTADRLYEKCFTCSYYIYDVLRFIPHNENIIYSEYKSVCKYVISSFPSYVDKMDKNQQKLFSRFIRQNFFNDIKLVHLLSNKKKYSYFKCLMGL